jgi:hypothetical protein
MIGLRGVNIQDGDLVEWMPEPVTECNVSAFVDPVFRERQQVARSRVYGHQVRSTFLRVGIYTLCYKFNYAGNVDPAPFELFPNIRVSVVRIDGVTPLGTAPGCATNLTLLGEGLMQLPLVDLSCRFGPSISASEDLWDVTAPAFSNNDTQVTCVTPSTMRLGVGTLQLVWHAALFSRARLVIRTFTVFDLYETRIDTTFPAGARYNLPASLHLTGHFASYGPVRCRVGDVIGGDGELLSSNEVLCPKPPFSDAMRRATGRFDIDYSPNGQCFLPHGELVGNTSSRGSFYLYNSVFGASLPVSKPS